MIDPKPLLVTTFGADSLCCCDAEFLDGVEFPEVHNQYVFSLHVTECQNYTDAAALLNAFGSTGRGYCIRENNAGKADVVLSAPGATNGGRVVITSRYVAIFYSDSDHFEVHKAKGAKMLCHFNKLLPTSYYASDYSRSVSQTPKAFLTIGNRLFEFFEGGVLPLGAKQCVFNAGLLIAAYGVKPGHLRPYYEPSNWFAGLKQLFAGDPTEQDILFTADSLGVVFSKNQRVAAKEFVASVRAGKRITSLAFSSNWSRPVSEAWEIGGYPVILSPIRNGEWPSSNPVKFADGTTSATPFVADYVVFFNPSEEGAGIAQALSEAVAGRNEATFAKYAYAIVCQGGNLDEIAKAFKNKQKELNERAIAAFTAVADNGASLLKAFLQEHAFISGAGLTTDPTVISSELSDDTLKTASSKVCGECDLTTVQFNGDGDGKFIPSPRGYFGGMVKSGKNLGRSYQFGPTTIEFSLKSSELIGVGKSSTTPANLTQAIGHAKDVLSPAGRFFTLTFDSTASDHASATSIKLDGDALEREFQQVQKNVTAIALKQAAMALKTVVNADKMYNVVFGRYSRTYYHHICKWFSSTTSTQSDGESPYFISGKNMDWNFQAIKDISSAYYGANATGSKTFVSIMKGDRRGEFHTNSLGINDLEVDRVKGVVNGRFFVDITAHWVDAINPDNVRGAAAAIRDCIAAALGEAYTVTFNGFGGRIGPIDKSTTSSCWLCDSWTNHTHAPGYNTFASQADGFKYRIELPVSEPYAKAADDIETLGSAVYIDAFADKGPELEKLGENMNTMTNQQLCRLLLDGLRNFVASEKDLTKFCLGFEATQIKGEDQVKLCLLHPEYAKTFCKGSAFASLFDPQTLRDLMSYIDEVCKGTGVSESDRQALEKIKALLSATLTETSVGLTIKSQLTPWFVSSLESIAKSAHVVDPNLVGIYGGLS